MSEQDKINELEKKIVEQESVIKALNNTVSDVCKALLVFQQNFNIIEKRDLSVYKILNSVFLITKPTHEYLEQPVLDKFVENLRILKNSIVEDNGKSTQAG